MNRRKPPVQAQIVVPGQEIPEYQEPITVTLDLRYEMPSRNINILYSLNSFLAPIGTDKAVNNYWLKRAKDALFLTVRSQIRKMDITPIVGRVMTQVIIYRGTNHGVDMGNFSILEKYATDAIVKTKKVYYDDNWKYIRGLVILDGGLDRENPRAEYSVIPASQYVFPKGI